MDEHLLGKVINGSYEIVGEVARGGMATVYRAHQISMNRDVAIKVLPREFLHEASFIERFRQEAEIAAHLEHRAIVPVYDYGEWDGVPYIVMRLMEGRSVDNLLERGHLPLEQVQQIIRQVASALDYAHGQGVLHRDLKPSNILLDRSGDAYITDFGIARILNRADKLTSTGVVGTPSYMSPEQAQGHELDGRSDIYALGVVAFEMLTGRRPFDGDTPYSVAVMQVTKQPPSPRDFNPDLPLGVESVILKALQKDRNRRYQKAIDLAGALDDADLVPLGQTVAHQATTAPPPTPPPVPDYHSQPTPQRGTTFVSAPIPIYHPKPKRQLSPFAYLVIAGGLAVLVSMILLLGYLIITNQEKPTEPDFQATGVFRLTATANGRTSSAAGNPEELIYVSNRHGQTDLYHLNLLTGNETRLTNTSGAESHPAVSPDGDWLAYIYNPDGSTTNQAEVYLWRMDGTDIQQITSNLAEENYPTWIPDGTALIYTQTTADGKESRLIRYELANQQESTLYQVSDMLSDPCVSPDGSAIVFAAGETANPDAAEIWLLTLEEGIAIPLTENTVADKSPRWNLSGDRIIFLQDGSGVMEIQTDGTAATPLFDSDGNESLAFFEDEQTIIFVSEKDSRSDVFLGHLDGSSILRLTFTGDIYQPALVRG